MGCPRLIGLSHLMSSPSGTNRDLPIFGPDVFSNSPSEQGRYGYDAEPRRDFERLLDAVRSSPPVSEQPPAPARVAALPNSVCGLILRDGGNDQNDQEGSKLTGGTRLHFWRGCDCREHGLIAPDPFSRCQHKRTRSAKALLAPIAQGHVSATGINRRRPRVRVASAALRRMRQITGTPSNDRLNRWSSGLRGCVRRLSWNSK